MKNIFNKEFEFETGFYFHKKERKLCYLFKDIVQEGYPELYYRGKREGLEFKIMSIHNSESIYTELENLNFREYFTKAICWEKDFLWLRENKVEKDFIDFLLKKEKYEFLAIFSKLQSYITY